MATPLRVLILEDSPSDEKLLLRELRRGGYEVEHLRVATAVDMAAALASGTWDVILSDYSMPGFSAPRALKLVQDKGFDIPFIIVSGTVGEDIAVEAMKAGAHDFFAKGKLKRLIPAVEREVREAEERRKRHLAENSLRESEERYRSLVESSPNGIIVQVAEQIVYANPVAIRLSGAEQESDLLGRSFLDFVFSGDIGVIREFIQQPDQVQQLEPREQKLRQLNGQTLDVEISVSHVNYYGQQGIQLVLHDITERKQTQDELMALYNATSFLFKADSLLNLGHQIVQAVVKEFKQADCGLLLVDKQQNRLIRLARAGEASVSTDVPLFLDSSGLVPEAARTGRIVYAPDVSLNPQYIPNEPQTQSEIVIPLKTLKGILGVLDLQSASLNAFSQRDERVLTAFAERAAAALEIMQLVEEINQHTAELEWRVASRTAQLNHAKNRIESILNSTSDVIILCHPDSTISQVNPAFDQTFMCQPDEVLLQPLISLVITQHIPLLEHALETLKETQQPQRLEISVHYQERVAFDAEVVLSAVLKPSEELEGIVCSLRDITPHKQMENQLRHMLEEAMKLSELKSRYVAMAAHDLRNPLAVIQISVDTLESYGDRLKDDQKQARFDQIKARIKVMVDMLDDILTIGRVESGKVAFNPAPLDLITYCQNLVAEAKQFVGATHQIDFSSQGFCNSTYVDVNLLQHILGNLLSNALKYSSEQSPVTFTVNCEPDKIVFRVQDHGIGIPRHEQARMFEAFNRASNAKQLPGTGLGLAIVKQSVELHGGTITFESEEGRGTTFTVVIPQTSQENRGAHENDLGGR